MHNVAFCEQSTQSDASFQQNVTNTSGVEKDVTVDSWLSVDNCNSKGISVGSKEVCNGNVQSVPQERSLADHDYCMTMKTKASGTSSAGSSPIVKALTESKRMGLKNEPIPFESPVSFHVNAVSTPKTESDESIQTLNKEVIDTSLMSSLCSQLTSLSVQADSSTV